MDNNLMNDQSGMFDDLMDNDASKSLPLEIDPDFGYAPNHDFDEFQNNSKATRISSDEGYAEIPMNIMDDEDKVNSDINSELIYDVLKTRGFNPESIKFENENGEIESIAFNELSKEDQIELLNAEFEDYSDEYSKDELEAINFLRENKMTIKDLAQEIRQRTIDELQGSQEQTYSVDDFSDEELFIVDFKHKYGDDYTEQELYNELEKAKDNEELFNKKMSKLRNDYKAYEQESKEEEFKLAQQQAEDTRNQYIQTVVNASKSISDFHETVEIDDNDRESLLEFIFDTDPNGLTQIQKALQDPSNVVKVAWYLQHGDDMIKQVHQYYQSEIAKLSKQNKVIKPETVIKPNQKNQHTTRPKTINDLYV